MKIVNELFANLLWSVKLVNSTVYCSLLFMAVSPHPHHVRFMWSI